MDSSSLDSLGGILKEYSIPGLDMVRDTTRLTVNMIYEFMWPTISEYIAPHINNVCDFVTSTINKLLAIPVISSAIVVAEQVLEEISFLVNFILNLSLSIGESKCTVKDILFYISILTNVYSMVQGLRRKIKNKRILTMDGSSAAGLSDGFRGGFNYEGDPNKLPDPREDHPNKELVRKLKQQLIHNWRQGQNGNIIYSDHWDLYNCKLNPQDVNYLHWIARNAIHWGYLQKLGLKINRIAGKEYLCESYKNHLRKTYPSINVYLLALGSIGNEDRSRMIRENPTIFHE